MPLKMNLTGHRFGRLTVKSVSGQDRFKAYLWTCRCDCGTTTVVRGSTLVQGRTGSCGCLARDLKAQPRSHGMTRTPLYSRWRSMIERTRNPNNSEYRNYGGRGIAVCDRWLAFENFCADMGAAFLPNLELDRVDVNGNYSPENCRWATRTEQQRNRRNNHMVTWRGQTQTIQEWAEAQGIKPNTLVYRLRRGWSVERALTTGALTSAVLLEIANGGAR